MNIQNSEPSLKTFQILMQSMALLRQLTPQKGKKSLLLYFQ